MSQIFALLLFFLLGVTTIFSYFSGGAHVGIFGTVNKFPTEVPWFFLCLTLIGVIGVGWSIWRSPKNTATFRLRDIILGGILVLLLVSIFTLIQWGGTASAGWVLFSKAIGFLVLPLVFVLIGAWLGKYILRKLDLSETLGSLARSTEIVTGLCGLIFTIAIVGFIPGGYALWSIWGIGILITALTYKDMGVVLSDLWTLEYRSPEFHSPIIRTIYTVIVGIFLMILFFVIATNLVNIVRPFPIGWDDLGVYMNFPKLMAYALSTSNQGMVFWQTFTGIGFLFDSPTQAFFLNQVGSFLTIVTLYSGISYFTSKKPNLLPYPLIATTIFCSMPMVVFQQAKDMKLDPALFGVSIISLLLVFLALSSEKKWTILKLMGLAGLLVGIAFSIKFTSIMIMVGAVWLFFYARLGTLGLIGFTGIFVGVFTRLHLWSFLNVSYPSESPWLNIFAYGMVVFGILCLVGRLWYTKEKKYANIFLPILVYSLGIIVGVGPWIIKNIVETQSLSVIKMLYGDSRYYVPDYSLIHSPEKLESIKELGSVNTISDSWKTLNEDLGRYFGYESGINNYLKLPYNLSNQKNQWGEFTDITYLYFALLPGTLLLIAYRRKWSFGLVLGFLGFLWMYYFQIPFFPNSGEYISTFFGGAIEGIKNISPGLLESIASLGKLLGATSLPSGYLWIIGIFSLPLWIIHFDKRSEPESQHLRYLVVFTTLYTLLFVVAAFGIVWYGILMYFCFLALIAHILSPLTAIETESDEAKSLGIGLGVLILILPYFLNSGIPNTWNNLPEDGFEYKTGKLTGLEATFRWRDEYITTLSEINLLSSTPILNELKEKATHPDLKALLESIPSDTKLDEVAAILAEKEAIAATSLEYAGFAREARDLRNLLYGQIVHPKEDNKNPAILLRIGTFLTYYVSENRSRYLDDSLLFEFNRYLYDTNPQVTIERLKTLGIRYVLMDLNAATIDRDPARNLTKRYESLLQTVKDPGFSLITTDSPCLRLALEEKGNSYLSIAGVNYVSQVTQSGGQVGYIGPEQKMNLCGSVLTKLIWNKSITDTKYSYFKRLSDAVWSRAPRSEEEVFQLIRPYINRGWFAAFEVK